MTLMLTTLRSFSDFFCENDVVMLVLLFGFYPFHGSNKQGLRYRSQLSPNAKKKCFWHKKISFSENEWRKKKFLKNLHRNITNFGYFMPLNHQLTS